MATNENPLSRVSRLVSVADPKLTFYRFIILYNICSDGGLGLKYLHIVQ